jgi:hypothetical protein
MLTLSSAAAGYSKGEKLLMEKKALLYEGKAKQIYAAEDERYFIMTYKDEATAFDGAKKGIIEDKGIINNRISCLLFKMLEEAGIKTHLVKQLDERNVLVKRMKMGAGRGSDQKCHRRQPGHKAGDRGRAYASDAHY